MNYNKKEVYMPKYIKLNCSNCNKTFTRLKKDVSSALNKKCINFFCSKNCMKTYRSRTELMKCNNCGKEFYKKQNQIKKTKKHFCNKKCFLDFIKSF